MFKGIKPRLGRYGAIASVFVLGAMVLVTGCQGKAGTQGPAGAAGAAGVSTGTLSGKITNSLTNGPVAGVAVATDPVIPNVNITTDASGAYTAALPIGVYTVNYKKDNFTPGKETVSLVAGQTVTKNVVLKPVAKVAVSAPAGTGKPGDAVTLKATATPLDGSTVSGYQWDQVSGVKATVDNPKSDTIKVTLPNAAAFKAELIKGLKTEDRFVVQAINPHALIGAETVAFKVTATTSSGTYSTKVNVTVPLPYVHSLGIQNVAQGEPVLIHGKKQAAYSWSLTGPTGAKAALDSATDQNPTFTPDVVGKYTVAEKTSGVSIDVYAGTWAGAITGQDAKGRPLSAGCTACHNGTIAADKFSAWKESGHAEIFTQNINDPNGHWAINCAQCHTVGYNPNVTNGGFDEAVKAENWQVPSHGDVGLWTTMLQKFPKTTKLANIQCENCHGPNEGSGTHANKQLGTSTRVSISSDVCGSCHGEPLRHGRYQQWEESGHANFELAIEDATVEARGATAAHCGRCHSGQGFLAWIKGDLTKQIQGAKGNATVDELKALGLTKDRIQPQTCTVCHDPHNPGTVSGEPTNATVRIMDVTKLLPAGFKAEDVGKGAICITCHNTRNGPHNDEFPTNLPTSYSAPHTAAQGDVLLGESAYLVEVPLRSPHASVKDTCVTCHMEKTPPPAEFSYNQAGTNHSFKASITICATCHSDAFNGKAFQAAAEEKSHQLAQKMSAYLLNKLPAEFTIKDYTPHTNGGKSYDVKSNALVVSKSNIASIEPTEPHGQIGFIFKFNNAVNVTYAPAGESPHTISMSQVQMQLGDILLADGKTSIIPITDVLVKVGWNYFLIHGDGSEGVHNPDFTIEVLNASIKALK